MSTEPVTVAVAVDVAETAAPCVVEGTDAAARRRCGNGSVLKLTWDDYSCPCCPCLTLRHLKKCTLNHDSSYVVGTKLCNSASKEH